MPAHTQADGRASLWAPHFRPMKLSREWQGSDRVSFIEAQACEGHPSAPVAAMTLATPDARILAEVSAKAMGSTSVTSPPSTWVTFGSGALPTYAVNIGISSSQNSNRDAKTSGIGSAAYRVSCGRVMEISGLIHDRSSI